MKKTAAFFALSLTMGLLTAAASPRPANSREGSATVAPRRVLNASPAGAAQGSVWKSQDEYNAYQAMANEKDPQKKVALAEAFLQKYPDSAVKKYVYVAVMNAYQQANDSAKAIDAAKKVLEVDADNLDALRYLSFAFPFTFKPDDPNASAELSRAESDAKHGLELLSKVQKPANVTEEQFQQAIKPVREIFNSTTGFVALQRKDYAAAITSFKAALEDNPTDLYVTYRLGVSYLMSTPPDYSNGFWYLGRAVSLGRYANSSDEGGMQKYLRQAYCSYHRTSDGLEEIINQAAQSVNPPADFSVTPAKPPAATGNPSLDAFNTNLKFPLSQCQENASTAWSQLKDKPLQMGGFVNSVEKSPDGSSYEVKVSLDQGKAGSSYDIVLLDSSQPKVAALQQGDPVRFQGTINAYSTNPSFSLTLADVKINPDDLEAAASKTKTAPRRRRQ